jgi:hypothetical protein
MITLTIFCEATYDVATTVTSYLLGASNFLLRQPQSMFYCYCERHLAITSFSEGLCPKELGIRLPYDAEKFPSFRFQVQDRLFKSVRIVQSDCSTSKVKIFSSEVLSEENYKIAVEIEG